jgi:hypothetical protein
MKPGDAHDRILPIYGGPCVVLAFGGRTLALEDLYAGTDVPSLLYPINSDNEDDSAILLE